MTTTASTPSPTVPLLEGLRDRSIYIGRKAGRKAGLPGQGPNFHLLSMLTDSGYRPAEINNDASEAVALSREDIMIMRGSANWYPKIWSKIEGIPVDQRPVVVFWQSEPLPQPRSAGLPRPRLHAREITKTLVRHPSATDVYTNARRLRRLQRHGLPHVLAVSSLNGAEYLAEVGIAADHVPLGYHPSHGRDLGLERDLDVLFLGALEVPRRKKLLRRLRAHGIDVEAVGHWSNREFWGESRTELINRAKIFLNLGRTPGAFSGIRLILGMANKALVVSEPFSNPAPFVPGKHFASAPLDELPALIEHYLADEEARSHIVDAGHAFVTEELTLARSLGRILELARDSAR